MKMKYLVVAAWVLFLAGCREKPRTQKHDQNASDDRLAQWERQCEAAMREWERQCEVTTRERERQEWLQRLSPLEMALEKTDRWAIDFVALMEKSPDGDVHLRRCLGGRIPIDVQTFVHRGSVHGLYLVGRLVPFGGYSMDMESRQEEALCYDVTSDGALVVGEELSTVLRIDEIMVKLAQRGEQAGAPSP